MAQTELRRLVLQIAAVQGVIFLKDLLRRKKKQGARVKLGGTKKDVLNEILRAVENGIITQHDLRQWLDEIEGWGRQHVYLYTPSVGVLGSRLWDSPEEFTKKLRKKGFRIPNREAHLYRFPDRLTLSELSYDGTRFQASWHRKVTELRRDTQLDRSETHDGDEVDFRAWRHVPTRSVMRYVLYPEQARAALFLQVPLGPEHAKAKETALSLLRRVLPKGQAIVRISTSIKDLDEANRKGIKGHIFRPQETKLHAKGASIEFSADATLNSYTEITAVREVRNAVDLDEFGGDAARFKLDLRTSAGMKRTVTISLTGKDNRVYLFARMTAAEVWTVLSPLFP